MKLSLVLPASLFACAGAPPPAPVVPVAQLPEPTPVTTTSASACAAPERHDAAPPPINVTVTTPTKVVDPRLLDAVKRMPLPEQTALVAAPSALRTIDGRPRLHGKTGYAQVEVTLPLLTSQCEATIQTAIQAQRPVEIKGKGRIIADQVPGHGYVSAFDIEDITSCISK